MSESIVLFQRRICETLSGNLAYTVGRLAFRWGRPMLVEHVGRVYLEHDLSGKVLTEGYGPEYNIVHVWEEERPSCEVLKPPFPRKGLHHMPRHGAALKRKERQGE
jgi:hypothetical protein